MPVTQGPKAIAVLITAPDVDEATRLAEILVERRLAACVQILPPMQSVYRWQGVIERQTEVLIIAKSVAEKFEELEREVRANHSYDTPEIVSFELSQLSNPYLEWLTASIDDLS